MKYYIYINGGSVEGTTTLQGLTLKGPLRVFTTPTVENEIATKGYVDSLTGSISGGGVDRGTMGVGRFPAYTAGALTMAAGSGVLELKPNGIVPGSKTKPTVGRDGIVNAGNALAVSDIPTLSWNKISNRPTKMVDYGITDAASTNAVVNGNIRVVGDPIGQYDLVTKGYLDNILSQSSGLKTGDVVQGAYFYKPVGTLRLNGGMVKVSDYPDLYAEIGDKYSKDFGYYGGGRPWVNHSRVTGANVSGAWSSKANLPLTRGDHCAFVTNGRVHILGGFSSVADNVTYSAIIQENGELGSFVAGYNLTAPSVGGSLVVIGSKVYYLGGRTTGWVATNLIQMAEINPDGTLGAWTVYGQLPVSRGYGATFTTKNRVYYVGGVAGSQTNTMYKEVYSAPILENGLIGVWRKEPDAPVEFGRPSLILTDKYGYIGDVAGQWRFTLLTDGTIGEWITESRSPISVGGAAAVTLNGYAYILGGNVASTSSNQTYRAPINADGTLGAWVAFNTMPVAKGLIENAVVVVRGSILVLGGHSGISPVNTVQALEITEGTNNYLPFYKEETPLLYKSKDFGKYGNGKPWQYYAGLDNADGGLGPWTSVNALPSPRYFQQSVVTKDRVYLIGGIPTSSGADATTIVHTAPINEDGSLGAWTTGEPLHTAVYNTQVAVIGQKVYCFGGHAKTTASVTTNIVQVANIDDDGVIGPWSLHPFTLPVGLMNSKVLVTSSRVYLLAGSLNDTTPTFQYWSSGILNDGNLSPWVSHGNLPENRNHPALIPTGKYVYLVGGGNDSIYLTTSLRATILEDGTLGKWEAGPTIPDGIGSVSEITIGNRAYILPSTTNLGNTNVTMMGIIEEDGTIKSFQKVPSPTVALSTNTAVVVKGKVHIFGGWTGSGVSSNISTASFANGGRNDFMPYFKDTTPLLNRMLDYGYWGNGQPWKNQGKIHPGNTLGSWVTSNTLPIAVSAGAVVATKDTAYYLGGQPNDIYTLSNKIYKAAINANGSLGTWVDSGLTLPVASSHQGTFVAGNKLYVVGGLVTADASTNAIYRSIIDSEGNLGEFVRVKVNLPQPLAGVTLTVIGNTVNLFSGASGNTIVYTYYTASLDSTGELGEWKNNAPLGFSTYKPAIHTTDKYVYLTGGLNSTGYLASGYRGTIKKDGSVGDWVVANSLPVVSGYAVGYVIGNKAYITRGNNATTNTPAYVATINADGTLGSWTVSTTAGAVEANSDVLVTSGYVHVIGGNTYNASFVQSVSSAPISGGVNDFMPYFQPNEATSVPEQFRLPDGSAIAEPGTDYYIKY